MALTLNRGQAIAVNSALDAFEARRPGHIIVGEGGTGKTFSVMEFVKILTDGKLNVLMAAPTNKAVKQLQKAARQYGIDLSRVAFRTIHSALGLSLLPTSERKHVSSVRDSILCDYDVLVLDEGSMLPEVLLFNYMLPETERNEMFTLIMGDNMQLPPVKETESKAFTLYPISELTQVERQKNNPDGTPNGILQVTHKLREAIKNNKTYEFKGCPDHNVTAMRDADFIKYILSQFSIETDLDDIRVLAWKNSTVNSINRAIRTKIYGKEVGRFEVGERIVTGGPIVIGGEVVLSTDEECIVKAIKDSTIYDEEGGSTWKTKVLTLEPIFDGGGQVFAHILDDSETDRFNRRIEYLEDRAEEAKISGGSPGYHWRKVHEFRGLFADLKYCYCMTVHRSQGSTFRRVILDVKDILLNPIRSERQRLIYVGMSRPQEELTINKVAFKA